MTADDVAQKISVEVVLAMPERQLLVPVELNNGSTIADAIEQSAVLDEFEGCELDPSRVGIFGRKAAISDTLRDGDRVEIYRPLIADPKESRRQRALRQAET